MKPNYEPPEFHNNSELEEVIEGAKEEYGIKLERGKFYSKKHFEVVCGFIRQWRLGELLGAGGIYLGSLVGITSLALKFLPYPENLAGDLGLEATFYCSALGAIALSDNLLPLYRNMCNKIYKRYCKKNDIPYHK